MSRRVPTAFAVAPVSVGMMLTSPAAHADPPSPVGPTIGSECAHYQLNNVVTASAGEQVRCVFTRDRGVTWSVWLPDTGPQQEPRMVTASPEEQANGYNYCLAHSERPLGMPHDYLRDSVAEVRGLGI